MMKKKIINSWIICGIMVTMPFITKAQDIENSFQSRISATATYKPIKKLKLELSPEFRFNNNFFLDKYFIEAGLEYKLLSFLSLGAGYRFIANTRQEKETEYLQRYTLNGTFKKKWNRFTPSFRIRYANYSDEDDYNELLRYKANLEYNIPKSKIAPFVSTEAFQSINGSDFYKIRYSIGIDYKLFKKNYLTVSYKLDYYLNEYKNNHILCIGYKIKL